MTVRLVKKTRSESETPLGFGELDRVRLRTTVTERNRQLPAGLTGTVVLCHGAQAYEVEFDGIHDFFEVVAEHLEKL